MFIKIKYLLLSLFLLIVPLIGFAQKFSYSAKQLEKIRYANKVIKEGIKSNDSLQIAEGYYLLAKMESDAGNYLSSQNYFIKSLHIQEKFGINYKVGRLYIRLYGNELKQGHYDNALKYLRTSLEIYKKIDSNEGLMNAYAGIGNLYKDPKSTLKLNYDSALVYYSKAKFYGIKSNDTLGVASANLSIGDILLAQKKPESIDYYLSTYKTYSKSDKIHNSIHVLLNLASAYVVFKQLDKAKFHLTEAQRIYDKYLNNEFDSKSHLISVKAEYYEAVGNWEEAFKYLKEKTALEIKQITADRDGAVSRLNVEFETQKKETQLQQQHAEIRLKDQNIKIQRLFLWSVGFLLLFTIILSIFLFRLSKKNYQISQKNMILIREQNHRVKNNLQVISSLLNLQGNLLKDSQAKVAVDESQLRIESMVILHRQLYDNEQLDQINMEVFVADLSEIIFQSYGLTHIETHFTISIHQMSADRAVFFGLVLNEVISNACKYAFNEHSYPILVINFHENANETTLFVKDNGTKTINTNSAMSFGMKLINMMATQLNGEITTKYDNGFEFLMKCKTQLLFIYFYHEYFKDFDN